MGFEIQKKFEYTEVSDDIGASLRKHEATIRGIQSKAIYDIGEELQAAHDELANHRNGIFYAWCESIGITVDTAKRILRYHDFISANCTNKEILESLPKTLIYEASKKSTPTELKQGVLNGDITTLKEYKALKAELEAEKKARADAESKNAELEGRAMETEQRAQTEVADVKYRIRMLKTNHEQERHDLTQRAQTAEAELQSLKVELLHKQSEVDAIKHEQKMQAEPQVVEIPDTASREEIARLRDQLAQSRKTVERQEARAASAEKSLAYQMERASKAQAELQALKNGMSLQVYAEEHKEFSQYQKSADEEYKTASLARKWLSNVFNCPNTEPELREWIRCLIKMHEDKQEAILSIRDDVDSAIKKLQIFHDVLAGACGVRRVK